MKWFLMLPTRFARMLLRRALSFVNTHPKFRRYVLATIHRLGLYNIARTIYARLAAASYRSGMRAPFDLIPNDLAHLSPRARQIYANLKSAIEHRQREGG